MRLGWRYSHPGPKSYAAALSNTETVLRGINIGIDAFNRWSFTNRGDLDGQWHLVRTWDMDEKKYRKRVTPEPVPYYSYGIVTRFCAKHSGILKTEVHDDPEVVAAALRSPKGNLTLYVLNKGYNEKKLMVKIKNLRTSCTLHRYQVTKPKLEESGFELRPEVKFDVSNTRLSLQNLLPPLSITTFSTYKLHHSDPGIIVD